jgi:hypothetical protein
MNCPLTRPVDSLSIQEQVAHLLNRVQRGFGRFTENVADGANVRLARENVPSGANDPFGSEFSRPSVVAEDARHIAIAAAHQVDHILTWNFKHIANPVLQRRIAGLLDERGLALPFICTPEELLGDDDGTITD